MNVDDAFPGKYLKASDLQGRRIRVEISACEFGKVGSDRKLILSFRGKEKQMIVNKTNMNTLVSLTASRETDDWVGWIITLYAGHANYQGQNVPAVRISDDPGSAQGPRRQARKSEPGRAPKKPAPPEPDEYRSAPPSEQEEGEAEQVYTDDIPF